MDEEKQTNEGTEEPVKDSDNGDKPQVPEAVKAARAENERMEKNIKRTEELVIRQEELAAVNALGGSESGVTPPDKAKETPEEYVEKFKAGEVNPLKDDGVI